MFVVPSGVFEATLDAGESALVGDIGVRILDNQGATVQAYSAASIIELAPSGSGVYAATRTAPGDEGQYTILWSRGSAGESLGIDDLVVSGDAAAASIPPSSDDWTHGPCAPWIEGVDVADCYDDLGVGTDYELLDDVASMASDLLFELSGRRFNGVCERTVRPCRTGCGCFGGSGMSWTWDSVTLGWRCETGDRCGCGTLSVVRLAGWPVREIVEVKIDGAAIDPAGYRLDAHTDLVRLDDAGPPVVKQAWPSCQNLALADTEEGTFSVTYTHGIGPPRLGVSAAAQLAGELWKACPGNSGECRLPTRVTKIVRQGLTMEKLVPLADLLKEGSTGLQYVDAFVAGYNANRIRRRPAVFSPDVQPFARRVGS